MYAEMSPSEMLNECGDSAAKWAAAFCEIVEKGKLEIDEGLMIAWFANAIEQSAAIRIHRHVAAALA